MYKNIYILIDYFRGSMLNVPIYKYLSIVHVYVGLRLHNHTMCCFIIKCSKCLNNALSSFTVKIHTRLVFVIKKN